MLSHKMDFNCCANRDGFRIDSHIYCPSSGIDTPNIVASYSPRMAHQLHLVVSSQSVQHN